MSRRRRQLPEAPVDVRVDDLDAEGRGVARVDGKVVFIDGALPGEEVRFRYTRMRGRFDEGQTVEVLQASPDRVEPRCAYVDICGGCVLQHLRSEVQVDLKQVRLLRELRNLGGVEPQTIYPPLTGNAWGYRRKARLGARYVPKKGGVLVGFRERRHNRVADIRSCEILVPTVGPHLGALRELLTGLHARDRVPQVEVAAGDDGTTLVFRTLVALDEAAQTALREFGQRHALAIYLQPGGPDTVAPLDPDNAAELTYLLPEFDLRMRFLPTDFVQVNADINRRLVTRAVELLAPAPAERIVDLFAGLGNFTLPLARRGADVVGLEGDAALVERARENAVANGVTGATFAQADLSQPETLAPWLAGARKLLLDPPRTGAQVVVDHLAAPYPERVVYVSCNPATLARDAGTLVRAHGYEFLGTGAVDMFPHTNHVESISVFQRPA